MINEQQKINLFKINCIQNKYKEISNIVFKLTQHINYLDNLYLIDINKKNDLLSELFKINKNINNKYNQYIIDSQETINNELLNDFINIANDNAIELLYSVNSLFFNNLPFEEEKHNIINIINNVGYSDLLTLFKINNINLDINNTDFYNLIYDLNDLFTPISFTIFNVNRVDNINFYWRVPTIYSTDDILQLTRELWIKKDNNQYYKIEGIFNIDLLSVKLKTSQLLYQYLFNKKESVLKEVIQQNCDVNINFAKKFIRFDYIGNIYCMNLTEYINYLSSSYKLYTQLIKSSFISIMKNFINNGSKLYNLYYIIFLLLLGNEDNADIASLLINLTKEKKINSINLYNLLNRTLPFFMQIKLKKSNYNVKNDLEKIKSITIENIDYKKQLLSLKNIPNNIKTLTLEKIEEMKAQNNEYYKQKNYVENILKYPWSTGKNYFDELDSPLKINNYLCELKSNLYSLTYGHTEAKDILLQTIAKWINNPESGGKPLGFVGPPGVGKTLLAKSISKALKIPFAEITLGGQNDGELLHGHGYTYSGSQPGLIIKKMVDMGREHCILFFDELDKTASKHGTNNEISSILIHLTDPNMNKSFQDRFFQGIDFPLDKVIMIFSYNDAEKIDPILLDRITEIKIKPYTAADKIIIVKNYIINELNLNINLYFEDHIIEYIIENYTNEAGIRDLKRNIEKIFLTLNLEILTNKINLTNYKLTIDEINRILLKPKNEITKIGNRPEIGIINGLYATTNGDGGIIPIQVFNNFTSSSFEIKLTGKQGDVMKESVQCSLTCAINYIKNNLDKYNIQNFDEYFSKNFKNGFHVHAPSTSTPKDGPSAGCAFTSAFISRMVGKQIINTVGMTGEIELTGKITKIGGLNFKLIGAKKAGIKTVYIPSENKDDLDDFYEKHKNFIDDDFKIIMVEYIDELIDHILI